MVQDAGHSQGVTSRDSEQIASLTTRYRLPRAIAIVASVWHDFYAVTILRVAQTSRVSLALNRILIKWHVSPRSDNLRTTPS